MNDFDFAYEDDDRNRRRRQPAQQWGQQGQQPGWGYPNGAPQDPQYGYAQQQQWGQPAQGGYDQGYGQDYGQGYAQPGYDPNYGGGQGYNGYDPNYGGSYGNGYGQGYAQPGYEPGYEQQPSGGGRVYGGGGGATSTQTRSAKNASKKKKKKRGGKGFIIALSVILLICGGGGYFAYTKIADMLITPDFDGEGSGEVTISIGQGASGTQMAKVLYEAGVIKSTKAFIEACDKNPDEAIKIQPGTYKLRKGMKAELAMFLLLKPESRVKAGIPIPEGWSSFRVFKLLSEKLKIPEADFKAAAADPVALGVPATWFTRKDGKAIGTKSIEGFLFPDTYEFPPNPTAKVVLETMVKRFLAVTKEIGFEAKFANNPKVSPYQGLIVASLAEAEAGNVDDLGKVARVAYNRVYKRTPQLTCACLQFDVTVNYSLELRGLPPKASSEMTEKELTDPKNPYNRNADGLVPTPINSPSKAALLGAASPPEGNWYYFVAIDKQGHSKFSETFSQFCKDNEEAVRNGVLTKSSC